MKEFFHKKSVLVIGGLVILIIAFMISQGSFFLRTATSPLIGLSAGQDIDFPTEFLGFSNSRGFDGFAADKSVNSLPPSPIFGEGIRTDTTEAKVIQSGNLSIEVDSINEGLDSIKNIAEDKDGFVINSDFSESPSGAKSGSAQIRVPFDTFDDAIAEIKDLALFVQRENISAQDVTEEYIDLQSQLSNLRAEERQYQEILTRAFNIEDILNVTQRLSDVRGRIERLQGRINFLDNRTDFSLISIQLTEEATVQAPSGKWRPLTLLKQRAQGVVTSLQGFVDNAITFVFWVVGIIPYLIVIGIVMWLIKKKMNHKKQPPPQNPSTQDR